MRKVLIAFILSVFVFQSVGCLIPMYDGDSARRTQQQLNTSENLRLMRDEWERFWFLDQPDHSTPWRNHGGMI
ncbi:MAG: hypothetical protein J6A23_05400 [Thermoguttaceae bacterium]|nr:hypothetical protein [Planctomycetaceae bacterium]MBO5437078.1 hypothetical protein [Thermoguttaceae bacterium]MBP3694876.1 hypothetical protein [Thermoguttaceae bacterium]